MAIQIGRDLETALNFFKSITPLFGWKV